MKKFLFMALVLILCGSCGVKPYEKGVSLAEEYNSCVSGYDKALEQTGSDFAATVKDKYKSRSKAVEDYFQELKKCHKKFLSKWNEIEEKERKTLNEFGTGSDASEFQSGLKNSRTSSAFVKEPDTKTVQIPSSVMQQIRTIIPPKPDGNQIVRDLTGHKLSEGKTNGYYSQSWYWVIEENEISDFKIVSVEENTDSRYVVSVSMKLSSKTRAYTAKAQVTYVLDDIKDWNIEFVRSLGMDIVKTGRYNECISTHKDGSFYYIENNCEITLEVAGRYIGSDKSWNVFRETVDPHGSVHLYTEEIETDYIERP